MTILTHDCPRCGANNVGFNYAGESIIKESACQWAGFFTCPKCCGPITALLLNFTGRRIGDVRGDIRDDGNIRLDCVEPPSPVPVAPEYTPAAAAEFYVEACDSLHRGKWTSAASMLRKCMEVALKEFAPDVEAWKLEKRINKLAAEHRITPALKDWAEELRLDGNDALHSTEPATEDLAKRMERLTHFLLIYLYTLPAQVEQARAERETGN
jgi:hypothetical protein